MRLPSNSPITLPFGSTADPYSEGTPHNGTDFAYIPDNKIYAPFAGTIILMPNNGRDGNGIYMYNGNQFHGLLHSSQYLVANGQQVQEGQAIGIMGQTGFAQGVHLHWCVKIDGQFIDPLTLVKEDDMTITTPEEVNLLWQLNGMNRPPTEKEVQDSIGRTLVDFLTGFLNAEPVKANLAKVKFYDTDVQNLNSKVSALEDSTDPKILDLAKAIKNLVKE